MKLTAIKKVGVFRALQLGDMLCVVPTLRALRQALPHAEISWIGLPTQRHFSERFRHYIDRFIEFPGWPGLPEQPYKPKAIIKFIKAMQDESFDLVLQMQGNGMMTNTMCSFWNPKQLLGLRRAQDSSDDVLHFPVSEDTDHEITRFFKLTHALGITPESTELEFPLTDQDFVNFMCLNENLQLPLGNYICVHPGARDPKRRWPSDNFAKVIDCIGEQGHTIVLTGSKSELDILEKIQTQANCTVVNPFHFCDDVSLGALALLIQHSRLLISNDTGVSHIAAALKIPSLVLFSKFSDPNRWAPLDKHLHAAIAFESTPDEVVQKAWLHLNKLVPTDGLPVLFN